MKLGSPSRRAGIRLVVALFAAATVSVSTCAAACLQVHCIDPAANLAQEQSGHVGHSSAPSEKETPSGDCAQHGHPGSFIRDRDASSVEAPSYLAASFAPAGLVANVLVRAVNHPEGRNHAPSLGVPIYEVDCSLRI